MADHGTFIIDHRNYFTFPDSFSHEIEPELIHRLIFKASSHCRIEINGDQWRNLQSILIQGCRFVDIRVEISDGQLKEFIIGSSKYVSLMDFRGTFPYLEQWVFDHCKYLSLKGPFIGKMALKRLIIHNCPQFKLFESPGLLPYVEEIELKQSHHGKIDFAQIEFPRLKKVTLEECNAIKIKNLGTILTTLSEFLITRCNKVWMNELAVKQLQNFAGFVYTSSKPEREAYSQLIGFSESDPNMAEIEGELADLEQTYGDVLNSDKNIDESESLDFEEAQIQLKFCPECGQKALYMARFCPNCGESFRQ
jgi:ribosomal protein S27AE